MTPFNLEQFKAGRKALTRDGHEATFIAHRPEILENGTVVGAINSVAHCWCEHGGIAFCTFHPKDLVSMAPVKRSGWLNVWQVADTGVYRHGGVFDSEAEAKACTGTRLATVRIEWEEL